jgi:hypothetical protein
MPGCSDVASLLRFAVAANSETLEPFTLDDRIATWRVTGKPEAIFRKFWIAKAP